MMTKKHFDAIAYQFKLEKPGADWDPLLTDQWERDVRAVAVALRQLNPRFKFSTFFEACGFDSASLKTAMYE
jgi:hypothetical protein